MHRTYDNGAPGEFNLSFHHLLIDTLKLPKSMTFVSIQIRESLFLAIKRVASSSGTYLKTSAHMS